MFSRGNSRIAEEQLSQETGDNELLRFLDERSVLVFRFSSLAMQPSFAISLSILPRRANYPFARRVERDVKEDKESVAPESAPNPCGSQRERRFTDY